MRYSRLHRCYSGPSALSPFPFSIFIMPRHIQLLAVQLLIRLVAVNLSLSGCTVQNGPTEDVADSAKISDSFVWRFLLFRYF